jgi:beta-N-acetylhexosaminidase
MLPAIFGFGGEVLTDDERAFFAEAKPAGFILFGRNCSGRNQLRRLTDSLRELTGRADLPILVDQEGGRVARLAPPAWPAFPAPARFGELYRKAPISAIEAARANALAIAILLVEAGITMDCAPLLDLRHEGAHEVIGDRAFGADPLPVAALGRAMLDGLQAGGVCGIVKHVPGHGRAGADSHVELPVVEAGEAELAEDLAPFAALADAPVAMTAHVLYRAWDPEHCGTFSRRVIGEVIRGRIGFDGLLISDDLAMAALSGPLGSRADAALDAGCDLVLYGRGGLAENAQIAAALGPAAPAATDRLDRALAGCAGRASAQSFEALVDKRDALLAYA